MLVLTRKAGEEIRIGEGIVLTVVAVDGRRVRLGLEAPRDVAILRAELAIRDARKPGSEPRVAPQVTLSALV